MTDSAGYVPTAQAPPGHRHAVPSKVQTFGMLIFLLGLAIVFASGMLVYVLIRFKGSGLPAPGAIRGDISNWKLFLSTLLVLAASFSVHLAVRAIKHERQKQFMKWLIVTDVLAVLFVMVQTPALIQLAMQDPGAGSAAMAVERESRLFTILTFYIVVHALHVLGGIIYLALVTKKAADGRYDHEYYVGVRHAAMYWHFLDVVWLMMFGTFLLIG